MSENQAPPDRLKLIMGAHGVRIWSSTTIDALTYPDDEIFEYVRADAPASSAGIREARAREVLAAEYERATDTRPSDGQRFHAANVRVMDKRDYADWKDRAAIRAMLAFSESRAIEAVERIWRDGFREARYLLDPSVSIDDATPEEDDFWRLRQGRLASLALPVVDHREGEG